VRAVMEAVNQGGLDDMMLGTEERKPER
jgi:hypothetical protein